MTPANQFDSSDQDAAGELRLRPNPLAASDSDPTQPVQAKWANAMKSVAQHSTSDASNALVTASDLKSDDVTSSESALSPSERALQRERENTYGFLFLDYRREAFLFIIEMLLMRASFAAINVFIGDAHMLQKLFSFGLIWSLHVGLCAGLLPFKNWLSNAKNVAMGLASLAHTTSLLALQSNGVTSEFFFSLLGMFSIIIFLLLLRKQIHAAVLRLIGTPIAPLPGNQSKSLSTVGDSSVHSPIVELMQVPTSPTPHSALQITHPRISSQTSSAAGRQPREDNVVFPLESVDTDGPASVHLPGFTDEASVTPRLYAARVEMAKLRSEHQELQRKYAQLEQENAALMQQKLQSQMQPVSPDTHSIICYTS
jgi:hypothetical protein